MFSAGIFAFGMILVELALIERTSSLSLSIVSYVKQFLQIFLAVLVFGTSITLLNSLGTFATLSLAFTSSPPGETIIGMIVTVCGLVLYSYIKTRDHADGSHSSLSKSVDESEEGISMIASRGSEEAFIPNGNGMDNHNGYSTIELTDNLAKT